jgi:hypothetical protein
MLETSRVNSHNSPLILGVAFLFPQPPKLYPESVIYIVSSLTLEVNISRAEHRRASRPNLPERPDHLWLRCPHHNLVCHRSRIRGFEARRPRRTRNILRGRLSTLTAHFLAISRAPRVAKQTTPRFFSEISGSYTPSKAQFFSRAACGPTKVPLAGNLALLPRTF